LESRHALVITQSGGSVEWRSTPFYCCVLAHTTLHNHLLCQLTTLPSARQFQGPPHLPHDCPPWFSPIGATSTSGNFTPSGRSTATSITSFSTNSGEDIFQDDFALLTTPQKREIHTTLGSRPALAGFHGAPKTQLHAKQKAAKNAKAKLVKDKKIAIAACEVESTAKKKEHFISFAEAKAAKAGSKVDEIHTNLAEATKGATVHTPPGRSIASTVLISPHSHPHKKCKGTSGFPSSVHLPAVCPQLSLHQTVTANKRVSGRFPLQFSLHSPEDLSSSKSAASISGEDVAMLVDDDSNNELETPFLVKDATAKAVKDRKIVVAAREAEAVGGKRSALFSLPRPRRPRQIPR
jgi:hypothetical protein